jgi:hypothetical protein
MPQVNKFNRQEKQLEPGSEQKMPTSNAVRENETGISRWAAISATAGQAASGKSCSRYPQ